MRWMQASDAAVLVSRYNAELLKLKLYLHAVERARYRRGIFNERDIKPARVPELYRDIGKNTILILYIVSGG